MPILARFSPDTSGLIVTIMPWLSNSQIPIGKGTTKGNAYMP